MKRRLFWFQLFALASVDWLHSTLNIVDRTLTSIEPSSASILRCKLYINAVLFLELASCLIESHIAVGFAVACLGWARSTAILLYILPLVLVFDGIILYLMQKSVVPHLSPEMQCFNYAEEPLFSTFVLIACAVSVGLYCIGGVFVVTSDTTVARASLQRRALWRGLSYMGNFIFTFGPKAMLGCCAPSPWRTPTLALLCLNGALNVGSYAFWSKRQDVSERRVVRGSVGTALDEPRATVSDFERLALERYFDLFVNDSSASVLSSAVDATPHGASMPLFGFMTQRQVSPGQ